MAYISQKAKQEVERIVSEAIAEGNATMDQLVDETLPYFSFNEENLKRGEARRKLRAKVKRKRDENGIPDNVILRSLGGLIVNLPSCEDVALLKAAAEQNRDNVSRANESLRKAERRLEEVEGQLSLFNRESTTLNIPTILL